MHAFSRSRSPEDPSDDAAEQQEQPQHCVDVTLIEQEREALRVKLAAAEERFQVTRSGGGGG